ncbi:hypothetical protein BLL52_3455 [Rhodoferax antarcticus ANT.BR]|uniref:Uncharacterized protein n=1 Tax=Rhodoferax antarcticus ANT.BR TaxID=1111071 RepID=A0A1Q8YBY5_9BURK|nr:hypothetical protein BLL52_3455 [Rhodoferax antarcticus ANT.BR]
MSYTIPFCKTVRAQHNQLVCFFHNMNSCVDAMPAMGLLTANAV